MAGLIYQPTVWGMSDVLAIATEYRGDHSPGANELNIMRDLWLDFDGAGITSLDRISGSMNKDWRLNAAEGINIGRATVDDAPVLITSLDGVDGIEVRSPAIKLSAVTRTSDISGGITRRSSTTISWKRCSRHTHPSSVIGSTPQTMTSIVTCSSVSFSSGRRRDVSTVR